MGWDKVMNWGIKSGRGGLCELMEMGAGREPRQQQVVSYRGGGLSRGLHLWG